MFGFVFGWRKASKCKSVVKQLQCRLKLVKNKRYAISTHLRHDIAQLIRIGEHNRALHRAQQLLLDENMISLYHLLLHFSDFILLNLSYIRRHRELHDAAINKAVSTLVFASARCGDLPELRTLRLLFGKRYGQSFVETALHLLPGNRVNPQVKEKLSIITVSDDAKSKLLSEIAAEYGLHLEDTPHVIIDSREAEEAKEAQLYKEEKQQETPEQRVFRFREGKRSRRRRSRSGSNSPIANDVECYYYDYKGRRRMPQKKDYGQCHQIVYNVFRMCPDQMETREEEERLKEAKHVHPKLPDYDQIAAHFTALRRQHMRSLPFFEV